MTEMAVRMGGGFRARDADGNAVYPDWMPDSMVMRMELAEAEDRREAQAEERARAVWGQELAARSAVLAAEMAAERGVYVSMRAVLSDAPDRLAEKIGRTRQEALAYHSALMDKQDAEARVRLRRALRREWPAALVEAALDGDDLDGEGFAADTSAPGPKEVAEREELHERALQRRIRRREIQGIAKAVVHLDPVRAAHGRAIAALALAGAGTYGAPASQRVLAFEAGTP